MYFLISKNDKYSCLAIHADYSSMKGCQDALKLHLIGRIKELFPYDEDTANKIYEAAKSAKSADEENAVQIIYDVDIHVYEDGASIMYGSDYEERYAIVNYTPTQHP